MAPPFSSITTHIIISIILSSSMAISAIGDSNTDTSNRTGKNNWKHFVLVHGACHGAWSWFGLATLLRSAGHRVTAFDLAASGINPKRAAEIHSFSYYNQPLTDFMAALPPEEKVVLVGHSLAGYSITVAMEKFPAKIAMAVFVTAFMPGPNLPVLNIRREFNLQLPMDSPNDNQYTFGNGTSMPPTTLLFGPKFLQTYLYQLSPPEDWTLATVLARPVPLFTDEDLSKEVTPSQKNYGSVRRAFILSEGDNVLKPSFQRWMIENNQPNQVRMIYGSDHMVMFSKTDELCTCLQDLAEKYDGAS